MSRTAALGEDALARRISLATSTGPGTTVARAAPPRPIGPDEIVLGEAAAGGAVVTLKLAKLLEGRLLIQGASGAGKSWTLRRLLEQSAHLIQQIVIDPEGEYRSLADTFGHLRIEAHRLDAAAMSQAGARVREHRLSVVVDLSELDREQQMIAIAPFLGAMLDAPRDHWRPALVAIDEAHLFAPFGGAAGEATSVRRAAVAAVTDLMSRGRKRGLCGVLATQRLARLSKSVVSEVHNFLIGCNTLDLDIRRAAETVGWDARRGFAALPVLTPGDFVSIGPAFSKAAALQLRVGAVRTRHVGATPAVDAPAQLEAATAAELLGIESLAEASSIASDLRGTPTPGLKAVRGFIRNPEFPLAARAWEALLPLAPDGAAVADLATHLCVERSELVAALALLDTFGCLQFDDLPAGRAVRISRGMLSS